MHTMSRGFTVLTLAIILAIYLPAAQAKGGGGGGHGGGGGGGGHSGGHCSGARGHGGGGGRGGYGYNANNNDTQSSNPYVNQADDTSNYGRGSSGSGGSTQRR
jgi:hypothetical protein